MWRGLALALVLPLAAGRLQHHAAGARALAAAPAAASRAAARGRQVSAPVYSANLAYLQNEALPDNWTLAAVMKYDAYGHGITKLAAAAAKAHPICVLRNEEVAAVAAANPKATILRIMPPPGPVNYSTIVEAIGSGHNVEELLSPLNQDDVLRAARDTGRRIPVHVYLFGHYGNPYGFFFNTSQQLQALVDSLDPKLVEVRGVMAHMSGIPDAAKPAVVERFCRVACPVAKAAAPRRVTLSWATTSDVIAGIPDGGTRMVPPRAAAACDASNVVTWARVGSGTYGMDPYENESFDNGPQPTMTWLEEVQDVQELPGPNGTTRRAIVAVNPLHYPAAGWWPTALAFTNLSANGRPAAHVFIGAERFQLAEVPQGNGSLITIDVSNASSPVGIGSEVCLLCSQHPLQDLGDEVGSDPWNAGLCLAGRPPQYPRYKPVP